MKGKLIKDDEGWWVQHKAKGLDGNLEYIAESMLHPDDVERMLPDDEKFVKENSPNVEFEMVTEVVASVGNSEEQDEYTVSYAKLIPSKEQQKQLITEIMDLDAKDGLYDTVNDTVNKMAEQYVNTNYPEYTNPKEKAAAIEDVCWGYNKAKETLYTEEQVREAIGMARNGMSKSAYTIIATEEEIIQSLKQPKKD
jgi:hypothetical protein